MKIEEVVRKVSELYRGERGKEYDLRTELRQVEKELYDAERNGGETITFARHGELTTKRKLLRDELSKKEQYCEGISCVREMLMDLGFDTDIK